MNKDQLRDLLNQPYRFDNWQKIVNFTFPNVSYLQNPKVIETTDESVESFRQIGTVRLNDGKNLAMFEVHVKENVNLIRNRVALRKLVAKYIDQERNHGVLAIYEKGTEDYRFTFSAKDTDYDETTGEFFDKETEAKRYTYILGQNESCRTARDRFWELAQKKDNATIEDVENAFSVEKLSKEFFNKYKEHYNAFVNYLNLSNYKISAFSNDEKAIRNFVKIMLGRIVFLHFVQKKGWLGASDENYQNGDRQFMYNLWQNSDKRETFYQLVLAPLFFEALNKNHRLEDVYELPGGKRMRIPYLGGGLFEKDNNEPNFLTFPKSLFENLFEFFNEYNFTIDENDPHENEVGIDPEMLGHIFENLLEDNKDKGAYYTPKEIVHYMTKESLIEYLKIKLENKNKVLTNNEKNALEYFVRYKLKGDEFPKKYLKEDVAQFYQNQLRFIQTYGSQINKFLDDIKICDPAIGSGAFPMGLLNEIYHCKLILNNTYSLEERAKVKRHIIENSIYGVDIEKGAVDIARLRFWLSLIVDEEKPSPLPNLDYKIVPGDSLVSRFEDEIIDIDWNVKHNTGGLFDQDLFDVKTNLLKAISEKQKKYFDPSQTNKEKLNLEIRNLKLDILINQLQLMIAQKGGNDNYNGACKSKMHIEADLLIEGWKRTLSKLKIIKQKPEKSFNHFDWKLDFPEILNPILSEKKCGFDIVIGNPPFVLVQILKNKEIFKIFKSKYETATYKIDTYHLFYELGLQLLNDNGILTFISPNTFLKNKHAKNLRKILLENTDILHVDNFFFKAFNEASVDTLILLTRNGKSKYNTILYRNLKSLEGIFKDNRYKIIKQQNFLKEDFQFEFELNDSDIKIINKIHLNYNKIGNFGRAYFGIQTFDRKIYVSTTKNSDFHKPVIDGGNIFKYRYTPTIEWVSTKKEAIKSGGDEKVYARNRITIRQIGKYPEGCLVPPGLYTLNTVYNIFLHDEKTYLLKFILGVINSSVTRFYWLKRFYDNKATFPKIKKQPLESIILPNASMDIQRKIIPLIDYIIFAHNNFSDYGLDNYVSDKHVAEIFEEVLDGVLFELFFKTDFEREKIGFISYMEKYFKQIDDLPENKKIDIIRNAYQMLRQKENEIRNNLKLMDTRLSDIVIPIKSSM